MLHLGTAELRNHSHLLCHLPHHLDYSQSLQREAHPEILQYHRVYRTHGSHFQLPEQHFPGLADTNSAVHHSLLLLHHCRFQRRMDHHCRAELRHVHRLPSAVIIIYLII